MTIGEARKILHEMCGIDYHYVFDPKTAEAFDIAIAILDKQIKHEAGITLDEFFKQIDNMPERGTLIVRLKYKYEWEKNYEIQNEILEWDGTLSEYVWLNDWDEGQTDVIVLNYEFLDNIFNEEKKND